MTTQEAGSSSDEQPNTKVQRTDTLDLGYDQLPEHTKHIIDMQNRAIKLGNHPNPQWQNEFATWLYNQEPIVTNPLTFEQCWLQFANITHITHPTNQPHGLDTGRGTFKLDTATAKASTSAAQQQVPPTSEAVSYTHLTLPTTPYV